MTNPLRFLKICIAGNLILLILFRIIFVATNRSDLDGDYSQVFAAFLHGLRFDFSILATLFLPLIVFASLLSSKKPLLFLVNQLGILFSCLLLFIQVGDLLYYAASHKRIGYEAFVYLDKTFFPILMTGMKESPVLILGGLFSAAYFFKLTLRWNKKSVDRALLRPLRLSIETFIILAFGILAWRGGTQRVPLRVADSFISSKSFINVLTMNSPYLVANSLFHGYKPLNLLTHEVALANVSKLLSLKDLEYPLLRTLSECTDEFPKYNVVVLLMESWTGKLVNDSQMTPEFHKLKKDGIYFDRFFSSGFRTTSGLFSVLTGFPDQLGIPVMRRPELSHSFASMSRLLKKRGYRNIFLHGGLLDFDNTKNMLVAEEFDEIYGNVHMRDMGGIERAWGFDDEFIFRKAHSVYEKAKEPFFSYVLSVSTHRPFQIPTENAVNDIAHPVGSYERALRYSDWSLGDFFTRAKESSYFDNTIFVITSDHTHHDNLKTIYDDQLIPLLIYAPKILKPAVISKVGSQVDILPTTLSLLKYPEHASMGQNLFDTSTAGFAYWFSGQSFGWIDENHISSMGVDGRDPKVFKYSDTTYNEIQNNEISNDHKLKAMSYLQLSNNLLMKDKIFDPNQLSQCK